MTTHSFDVDGAFLVEFRIGITSRDLIVRRADVLFEFLDEAGRTVPAELAVLGADWARTSVPVFPAACFDEDSALLACSTRFVVVPFGTSRIRLSTGRSDTTQVDRARCVRVDLTAELGQVEESIRRFEQARRHFLKRVLRAHSVAFKARELKTDAQVPVEQIRDLEKWREKTFRYDWSAVLSGLQPIEDLRWSYDRAQVLKPQPEVNVAAICSDRLFHSLAQHFTVFHLPQSEWSERLKAARPHAIVIETVPQDHMGHWHQKLLGLDGGLHAQARALIDWAKRNDVPIVAFVTTSRGDRHCYQELVESADHVVDVECVAGATKAVALVGRKRSLVPPTFERRLAGPGPLPKELWRGNGILFGGASDLFQQPDLAPLVKTLPAACTLISEAIFDFATIRMADYGLDSYPSVCAMSYRNFLHLWRCARIAVFHEHSLATPEQQACMILDALGCGAVPIFIGDPSRLGTAGEVVIPVFDAADMMDRVMHLMDPVAHEIAWLRLYRRAVAEFSFENTIVPIIDRLAGRKVPDLPRVLCVTVSKRPHRLQQCLENFRRQACERKFLIIVLNSDLSEEAIAKLRTSLPNDVHLSCVGSNVNIGWCINHALSGVECDYWFKMDDDDYYGPHYVTDLLNHMVASKADVVGKPPVFVHLSQSSKTVLRRAQAHRGRRYIKYGEYVCGATLAGRREFTEAGFSYRVRNANDTRWTEEMHVRGGVVYLADGLNFVVYRSGNTKDHTWKMEDSEFLTREFLTSNKAVVIDGNARDVASA